MAINITRQFELWRYAGKVLGSERSWVAPSKALDGFEFSYFVRGKTANYILVTHDSGISLADAERFCSAIAQGKSVRLNVDLSNVFFRRDQPNKLWIAGEGNQND